MKTNPQALRPQNSLRSVPPHLPIDVLFMAQYRRALDKMTPAQLDAALSTARTELAYEKCRQPRDVRAIAFLATIVKMIVAEQGSRKFGDRSLQVDCFEKKVG